MGAVLLDISVPTAPDWQVDWASLCTYTWVRALRNCPQDPVYHAEGDVGTHTHMVLQALVADPEWRGLPEQRRLILYLAALLHDVAKPATTVIEPDGRVTARGHSSRGAIMARGILWDLGLPFDLRESVCGLIRHHQAPFFLIDQEHPLRRAAAISLVCRGDDLTMLARADMKGRIAPDIPRVLDNIALFRQFCEENHCLDQPFPFPSAHARAEYFRRPGRDIHYAAYDDSVVDAVLMSGLPGAGKDTWIHEQGPPWPVVSLDQLREEMGVEPTGNQGAVVHAAREQARIHLRRREPFIWNATNVSRSLRGRTLQLLADYHARVRIVYVEAPSSRLFQQNASRSAVVPPEVIRRLLAKWEVPNLTEAHALTCVIQEESA